jgi:DNA-binding FrmR family transcriptional regulator
VGVYMIMEIKNHIDKNIYNRLSKVEGQIRGIKQMAADGRSCSEILNQIYAVQNALRQISKLVLLDHLENCVVDGIQKGDVDGSIEDIKKVIDQFSKMK